MKWRRLLTLVFACLLLSLVSLWPICGGVSASGPFDASSDADSWSSKGIDADSGWKLYGDWASKSSATCVGSSESLYSLSVASGRLVKVTSILAVNWDSDSSDINFQVDGGVSERIFMTAVGIAGVGTNYSGELWLGAGDRIRANFGGIGDGDSLYLYVNGVEYQECEDFSDLVDDVSVMAGKVVSMSASLDDLAADSETINQGVYTGVLLDQRAMIAGAAGLVLLLTLVVVIGWGMR